MPQTTVLTDLVIGLDGQLADISDAECVSKVNTESDDSIPFGRFVAADGEEGALKPAAQADQLVGVVVRADHYARAWTDQSGTQGDLDSVGLRPGIQMSVLKEGVINAKSETNASAYDPVFVRCVAAGAEEAGIVRNSADASDCQDLTGKARYLTDVTAGNIAKIEIIVPL